MARTYRFSLKLRMPSSYKASAVASAFGPLLQEGREGIEIDEQPEDETARQTRQSKHFSFIGHAPLLYRADNIRQPCNESSFPQRKFEPNQLGPPCMCPGRIRHIAELAPIIREACKWSPQAKHVPASRTNTLGKLFARSEAHYAMPAKLRKDFFC